MMVESQLENAHEWWQSYIGDYGSERPSHFAETLAKTIPRTGGEVSMLDLGCGSGIVGLCCLIQGKARSVTFADLRREWIEITRENVARKVSQGIIGRSQVAILEAGCFTNIPADVLEKHDLVAFNPPQLPYRHFDEPALREIEADRIRRDFRFGGPDGLDVVRGFLKWYAEVNHRKPVCIMVLSSFLGRRLIDRTIQSFGLKGEILSRTRVPLRSAFWAAAEHFSKAEREDRCLNWGDSGWTKRLLTYRIDFCRGPKRVLSAHCPIHGYHSD